MNLQTELVPNFRENKKNVFFLFFFLIEFTTISIHKKMSKVNLNLEVYTYTKI
jgi:hypothetical protein